MSDEVRPFIHKKLLRVSWHPKKTPKTVCNHIRALNLSGMKQATMLQHLALTTHTQEYS